MRRRSPVEKEYDVLWKEYLRADFPARLRGEEIDGIDAVTLDSLVAGCALSWRASDVPLDPERLGLLRQCLGDLDAVVSHLKGDEAVYFSRLHGIALLVLTASDSSDVRAGCDYCGRITDEGPDWLGVEIFREADPYEGWGEHRNVVFCTQEHAGRYFLERPLPPVVQPAAIQRRWRDRIEGTLIGFGWVCAVTLMALGALWIVQALRA